MAQLDPSIILGARPLQIKDPLESFGNALAVQGAQQTNALRAQQMQQAAEDRAYTQGRRTKLNALLGQGLTGEQLENELLKSGYVDEALKFGKDRRENLKTDSERVKNEAETSLKRSDLVDKSLARYQGLLSQVDSPQAAAQWLTAQYNDPSLANTVMQMRPLEQALASIPQDPAQFQEWRNKAAMGMEKFRQDQTTRRGQDLTAETARRGQNMTDAREREAPRGMPLETANGPVLVNPRTGQATPITVGGTPVEGGKSTEGEKNAAGFLSRMNAAEALISENAGGQLTESTSLAGAIPGVGPYLQRKVMTPQQQKYKQAADDWIRAKLRKESGAAIGKDEMRSEYELYFPQPGDDKEAIAQKAEARKQALTQMQIGAGNAAGKARQANSSPTAPKAGDVMDGYRFKGGNPADPSSWERQ